MRKGKDRIRWKRNEDRKGKDKIDEELG